MAVLSLNDAGQDVYDYDDTVDGPMSLVGEGALGDALVIQIGSVVRPQTPGGGGSVGDVSRFGATLDNRITRWHGTTAQIQNTGVIIDDSDNVSQVAQLTGDRIGLGETSPLSILTMAVGSPSSPSQGGPDKMLSCVGRMASGDTFRAATFTAERLATSGTSSILVGVHANAEDYGSVNLTNADRAIVGIRARAAKSGGSNGTIGSMRAVSAEIEIEAGVNGITITDACTIVAEPVDCRGVSTIVNACSFRAKAHTVLSGTIQNARGFWIHKQTVGTVSNHGIVLDDDGIGADIAFGAGQDALAYWTGSALRFAAGTTEVVGDADTFQVRRDAVNASNTRMGFWNWNAAVTTEYKRGELRAIRVNDTVASGNMEIWVNNVGTLTKAMRLKWDLKAEFPGILYAGTGLTRLTNTLGELVLTALEQDGASPTQALVWNGSEWAPGGVMPAGGAVGGSGTIGTLPKWTAAQALGNSLVSESGSTVSIAGLLTVNSDIAGVTILGRAKIGTVGAFPDTLRIGHFDHFSTTEYGLFVNSDGFIAMSAPTGQGIDLRINAVTQLEINATDIGIPTNHLTLGAGNVEVTNGDLGVGTTPLTDVHVDMKAPADLTTLAGSVLLQAFNNSGDGNFGAGIIFGRPNGAATVNGGASILAYQDGTDADSVGLILATHRAGGGDPRVEALRLDSLQNVGIGGVDPTIKLDVNGKGGYTSIGGVVVKLTNKTGANSVTGQLVIASTGTDEAFDTALANDARVIGVVYNAGVADGSEVWVVVAGHADILVDGGGCTHGDRFATGSIAGFANVNNSPSNTVHFREIGHSLETRSAGPPGLARGIVHLN